VVVVVVVVVVVAGWANEVVAAREPESETSVTAVVTMAKVSHRSGVWPLILLPIFNLVAYFHVVTSWDFWARPASRSGRRPAVDAFSRFPPMSVVPAPGVHNNDSCPAALATTSVSGSTSTSHGFGSPAVNPMTAVAARASIAYL
jgi:hypothetical protein